MVDLRGKTTIVIGGSHGLGRDICLSLAKQGVNIALVYRSNSDRAMKTLGEIHDLGVSALNIFGDVSKEEDVKIILSQAKAAFDSVDFLINTEAICPERMITNTSFPEWKRVLDYNLSAVFLTCRDFVNYLASHNKTGAIINIASRCAFDGSNTGKTHFSTSKGGVIAFTLSFAREVEDLGIRVYAVVPEIMYSKRTADILDCVMDSYSASDPMQRVTNAGEVAAVVERLLNNTSKYKVGSTIDVSRGVALR